MGFKSEPRSGRHVKGVHDIRRDFPCTVRLQAKPFTQKGTLPAM
jgi:hypothetical protein